MVHSPSILEVLDALAYCQREYPAAELYTEPSIVAKLGVGSLDVSPTKPNLFTRLGLHLLVFDHEAPTAKKEAAVSGLLEAIMSGSVEPDIISPFSDALFPEISCTESGGYQKAVK